MARLSILIPCLADKKQLESTLESILTSRSAETEIVVVDRSGYQDPYGLDGEELTLLTQSKNTSWVDMLQSGLERCNADVVHILGSGLLPAPGWSDSPLSWFDDLAITAVAPLVASYAIEESAEPEDCDYSPGLRLSWSGNRDEVELAAGDVGREVHGLGVSGPLWNAGFFRREFLEDCLFHQTDLADDCWDLEIASVLAELELGFVIDPNCRLSRTSQAEERKLSSKEVGRAAQGFLAQQGTGGGLKSTFAILQDASVGLLYPSRLLRAWGRISERLRPSYRSESLAQRAGEDLLGWGGTPILSIDRANQASMANGEELPQESFVRRAA